MDAIEIKIYLLTVNNFGYGENRATLGRQSRGEGLRKQREKGRDNWEGNRRGGRRSSDRCVALVSSGHRRLRLDVLRDVANPPPDSLESRVTVLSRLSLPCFPLPPRVSHASPHPVSRASVAPPSPHCQPTATLRARDRFRRVTALSGWGPAFRPSLSLNFLEKMSSKEFVSRISLEHVVIVEIFINKF